jgi:hypothetical protein
MKNKKLFYLIIPVLLLAGLLAGIALAEDGDLFRRNISKTPDAETEKAAIYMMDFYVPAQSSAGLVAPVDNYLLADEATVGYEPRYYAKPLVSVYIDDLVGAEALPEGMVSAQGGVTFGEFDAFVGYSLDDGTSWRTENLSRSADLSSFNLENGHAYPGDVHNVVHQVAEDKILAVWASKYCQSGNPLYAIDPAVDGTYLADLETTYGKNALYLYDFFGVAGNQGSVDYTEQGFPEVGEIPYSCIWTARGKLLPGDDPITLEVVEATHIVWTKPERLTSGVRDANLPAVDCAKNAGCALTWQEDPEGLRPGKGLGPGEGWSGAIANAKTDIWYSYITFADFDLVTYDTTDDGINDGTAMLIEDYEALMVEAMDMPKPYVPMAIPVRLTDNDMCKAIAGTNGAPEDPFCWTDFDSIDDLDNTSITTFFEGLTGPETGADFCNTTMDWTNPGGTTLPICVTEDGRWMIGRVGSTRVRMVLKPYTPLGAPDHDADGVLDASAWLSLGAEETKALGITGDLDGDGVADVDPVDIGKDMFYYSFDYAKPYNLHVNTALDAVDDSAYIVQQGGMINQPAKCSPYFITTADTNPDATCPAAGEFFDVQIDPFTGYEYYLTEISRRFAMTLNNIPNITNTEINESGLSGMLIYKQGIIWQGGPADIMLRRLVVPDGFDATVDNPFAFENMECDEWLYTDGLNPNYLKGLCVSPAINISGSTIKTCTTGSGNEACAADFPVADDGTIPDELSVDQFPKVTEWRQCDGLAAIDGCENSVDTTGDLDDQSWENPYEVAKGHRGFLYGDMVMMMYAWSPNWQSNAVGNDHYNLYQRRSFDGGVTWTTTPSDWCGPIDGVCGAGLDALEYYYGETIGDYVPYIWSYEAGAFEQARNLSLLHGNKVTILDPRYSPPGGLKQYSTIRTDWLETNIGAPSETLPYPDDLAIDPSKFYMVYETGDNTTVAVGEAIPLDLYYSRATAFGDVYEWYDYVNDPADGDPVDGVLLPALEIEPRFPWLENQSDILSGEASVVLNPGGTFAYNVWNQWKEEITVDEFDVEHVLVYDSDIWFRRLLYLPDDSTLALTIKPVATILYVSTVAADQSLDEIITLAATAQAFGSNGIEDYRWQVESNGQVIDLPGCEKLCSVPARTLEPGWARFSFDALDRNGNWSQPASVNILIAEVLTKVRLPLIKN